ncbi:hypothetical protein BO71DRAFT_143295 [Aspergillus ellipticus CBS 707.79]|uniref:Zn(2)-C6 fungal-type domain-containing protein n=1 Tax=Aspergillus ellipticus CBS 707.79 TaxID=1448320 RepID=A0A319EB41_9EURO|nr:hypothetical protein BO71DRAFT_143295 [Aspergillus ellipticus CBS 707.79]
MAMVSVGNSPKVCLICKAGKRKCDKALPTCSRCARLQIKCRYESTADAAAKSTSTPLRLVILHCETWTSWISVAYTSAQNDPGPYLQLAETYFGTVDKWMPILDKDDVVEPLQEQSFSLDSKGFLLLMSVCLIVQRPDAQPPDGEMASEHYDAVKHFFFREHADTSHGPSLKLIQAGVLLATYEYGHGMIDAAYNTIYACISASLTLGMHRSECLQSSQFDNNQRDQTQVLRTWWAIVISERILCLWNPKSTRLPITRVRNELDYLSDLGISESNAREDRTVPKGTSPGANFYRQFQASILIGRVIELTNDPEPASERIQSRFKALDCQLQRAIQLNLGAETKQLNSVSEALAMNRSALVVLHQWQYHNSLTFNCSDEADQSRMVTDSMTTIMVDTVHDFLPRIYAGWPKSHHPQGTQSVYQAALALLPLQGLRKSKADLEELKEMLGLQSRRWAIAAKYLQMLNNSTLSQD